ncbi:enoyl-CoA hydratase/isomerase family protein [Sneathiella sp.]|jgi:enoyl-CoA hydratase|uniref:enoyl-CoA hydratase/isomerase family protein n=1 Tax=Sneathiella sp. TaxID=1964365 RepID=UPI0039E6BE5B
MSMSVDQEIYFEQKGQLGVILLNRPKALNALTHEMAIALHTKLDDWAADNTVQAVLIKGAGEKAFCAGGDIVKLYNEGKAGGDYPYRFYEDEYKCNAAIKHFPKPYIAFMDGIVMGGGVGVSVHGSHCIATERTLFAMPESGIGLFPDVGGTYFLPRCPGEIGMYLGLTGARLKAADTVYAGVASTYVQSVNLDGLEQSLASMQFSKDPHGDIDQLIAVYAEQTETPPLEEYRAKIDKHFSADSVEGILASLDEAGDEWAVKTAAGLRSKSPTSMKVTCRQIRSGASKTFDDCMKLEWRMVNRIIKGHDFYEGTRAVVIDKDQKPVWSPATLEDVKDEDIDSYFTPLAAGDLDI